MKIGIACDHEGFRHKENLKNYLKEKGIEVNDFGCYTEESVDYPDFAHELAKSIQIKKNDFGIQFCVFAYVRVSDGLTKLITLP